MLSNKSFLLVDFSNVAYAAFFGAVAESKLDTEKIPLFYNEHVFNFKKRIESITRYHGLAEIVYALDRKPKYKYEIYPDYKKGRGKLTCVDGSFFDVRAACLEELEKQRATVIYAEDYEADDAIASFVAQNFYSETTVVTTDKDLWAILDHPNVRILNFIKGEYITKQHLREAFCIKDKHKVITQYLTQYSQIKLWKQLWGDSGDNIPNAVPRMKKQLLPFIKKSDGTWEDFEAKLDYTALTEKCKTLLKTAEAQIKINSQLAHLKYNCKLVEETYQKKPVKIPVQTDPISLDGIF